MFVLPVMASAYAHQNDLSTADVEHAVAVEIERLGDPRYAERVDAKRRLLDIGLRAFDAILEATDHHDPEVAAMSEELLHALTRDWARRADPPWVRRILSDYGDKSIHARLVTVRTLGGDEKNHTIPALCRVCRFDPSPRVSREAAIAILGRNGFESNQDRLQAAREAEAALTQECGASRRVAPQWVSLAIETEISPSQRLDEWNRAIEVEDRVLQKNASKTDESILAALMRHRLIAALDTDNSTALIEAAQSLVVLDEEGAPERLVEMLDFLADAESWETIDHLLATELKRIETKKALYLQARFAHRRGQINEAEDFAQQAFETDPASTATAAIGGRVRVGPRIILAEELYDAGFVEWARRELRAAGGEAVRPISFDNAFARWRLADSLQDAERFREAAELLAELSAAISESQHTRRLYKSIASRSGKYLPPETTVNARRWLYEAHAHKSSGDSSGEVDALEKAISQDPSDADVLIAMYRVENASEAFSSDTRRRIVELCEEFEEFIAENPGEPTWLNQWAWLVSNTEGDYAKAVRYSRRSLEFSPGEPGYLDTLGRCLYSTGDLEAAREVQQQAVDKEPTMLVMQRQLDLIERAIAERDSTGLESTEEGP